MKLNVSFVAKPLPNNRPTRGMVMVACEKVAEATKQDKKWVETLFAFCVTSIVNCWSIIDISKFIARIQKAIIAQESQWEGQQKLDEYLAAMNEAREKDERVIAKTKPEQKDVEETKRFLLDVPRGGVVRLNATQRKDVIKELVVLFGAFIPKTSPLVDEVELVVSGGKNGPRLGLGLWLLEQFAETPQDWSDFKDSLDALAGDDGTIPRDDGAGENAA